MTARARARMAIALVAAHAAVTVVHGNAHGGLGIGMSPWQNAYILLVIVVLPIAAGLWIAFRGRGYALLGFSMAGALLFGVYYHFIAAGADNVASVAGDAMGLRFRATAVLLAITEAGGAIVGLVAARTGSAPNGK